MRGYIWKLLMRSTPYFFVSGREGYVGDLTSAHDQSDLLVKDRPGTSAKAAPTLVLLRQLKSWVWHIP